MLAADEVAKANATGGSSWGGIATFAVVIAVIVLPFVAGNLIAGLLKMKDVGNRLGITLFCITLAVIPFCIQPLNEALRLGIDLAGGTNLVYEVDRDATEKEITPSVMDKMEAAVRLRVNPTGTEEVTVRTVGSDRIEVIVPGADQEKVEETKRKIVNLGELEFALLANQYDHPQLIALATERGDSVSEIYQDGKLVAMWRPSARDADGEEKVGGGDGVQMRTVERGGREVTEFLVVVDPNPKRRITGRMLRSVSEILSERGLAVSFRLDQDGARLFQEVTTKYQPREGAGYKTRLAILLNNQVHSAPSINSPIPGGQGQIDGNFTQAEIDELLGVLNAGALEVPLKKQPVNESTVSPLLGLDVQQKGKNAMIWSLIAVFVVTGVYYLQAGFIADVCLAINLVLVLGAMALIDATFTLPGLAGLVLTVGMAVDANVLIFERMREERTKGSSLRMAIKNGFEKAFSTIFDANITTLITAVVLYYIGTDQVKGFAVTLFVGICTSMFSAVYIGRLIFDIAERKHWLTDLKMFSLISNDSNIDFVGKKKLAAVFSIILIIIGLFAVTSRGRDNLDIDFRGGAMATFRFEEDSKPTFGEIRSALEVTFDKSISLEELEVVENDKPEKMYRLRTVIVTENEDIANDVRGKIGKAFAGTPFKLIEQEIEFGPIEGIAAATDAPAENEAADPFPGGNQVVVKLKEPMTAAGFAATAQDVLVNVVGGFGESDVPELVAAESAEANVAAGAKLNEIRLRLAKAIPRESVDKLIAGLEAQMEGKPLFEEVNTFDGQVAGEAQAAAITAMLFSLGAIIAYLWLRFQAANFGLAAVVALVHDVLITLGALAVASYLSNTPLRSILLLEDFKINLSIVAAFLTIIGYSLNDTIVVFDRIREVRGRNPAMTEQMINISLNQTLSRTLLTSMTTLVVLIILYFMGGEGIHGFAFCLLFGIIVGTYSSIYVAAPVLVWLMNRNKKKAANAA
ncbi:MAG: protein translocase subunit SecD [Planctomycetaceae bacterium]|nr:protein translocase subunit SecD [Planctomycetaceae bacterium]